MNYLTNPLASTSRCEELRAKHRTKNNRARNGGALGLAIFAATMAYINNLLGRH